MVVEKSGNGGTSSSSTSAASSMDRFHKIILSWDYLCLVADSKGAEQAKGLWCVKNTYASVAEYLAVFELLLFEEVKAQVVQGRSDEEEGWARLAEGGCELIKAAAYCFHFCNHGELFVHFEDLQLVYYNARIFSYALCSLSSC